MIHRATLAALVGAAGLVLGITPAGAEGASEFNAPLLGTTATQQWSRLPDPASLLCADGCRIGLLPRLASENGAAAYIPSGPSSWGLLAKDPALVGKVVRFYEGDRMYAGAQIIEVRPGTPIDTVMKRLISEELASTNVTAGKELMKKEVQSDGWTLWVTNVASSKTGLLQARKAAYATKGNEIIRVYCDGETRIGGSFCGGLADTALKIARTKPGAGVSPAVGRLAPATTPTGMVPQFAASMNSGELWYNVLKAPRRMIKALGKKTLTLQWSVASNPALTVTANITTLRRQQNLKTFLSTICDAGDATCAVEKGLAPAPPGGQAAGAAARPEGESGDWAMEFQAGDDRLIADIVCVAGDGFQRALTTSERQACTESIAKVSKAVFARP